MGSAFGPWDPFRGLWCNPQKLLDPYAKAIEGDVDWHSAVFPFRVDDDGTQHEELPGESDSAAHVPRSIVVDTRFDWGEVHRPRRPLHQTEIYELHVKRFTARMPGVPPELRGTYAGLARPASRESDAARGERRRIDAVHQFVHDGHLIASGLRNYWGYNWIGFFAPHNEHASSGQRGEQVRVFQDMVRALHRADIEVILDVVYNHTAEGNHLGPVLSFKGFDNAVYYRLVGNDLRYAFTGRRPSSSVNFVSAHDGFTLRDLVSYNDKHNETNGEDNRKGESQNRSWNHDGGRPRGPRDHVALRPPTAQLPGDAALVARRSDDRRRRRNWQDTARQQQCLLPGQRDLLNGQHRLVYFGRRGNV